MRGVAAAAALLALVAVSAGAAGAHTGPGQAGPRLTELGRLIDANRPVFCGGRQKRLFALTFDDGPSPWTEALVGTLREQRAPATFFLVGNRISLWPADARAAAGYGPVGDHTWSHALLTALPLKRIVDELTWTESAFRKRLGVRTRLFRPPYDRTNAAVETAIESLRLLDVRWNVDSGDSAAGATANRAVRTILQNLGPGAIVLLHDSHPWTAQVVRRVLEVARTRHLRPVTVPRLLEVDPPGPHTDCYA